MKCRYAFGVKGALRLKEACPLVVGDVTFQFLFREPDVVAAIEAELSVPNADHWPHGTTNPRPGVAADFNFGSAGLERIVGYLRIAEGLLSLYGVESIDTESFEQKWIPETDDERAQLDLFGFRRTIQRTRPDEMPYVPFELVARSIVGIPQAHDVGVEMSFYRKGRIDFIERRYIEAIYDCFFMFETLFANGKSRSDAVKAEFKKANRLREAIERVIADAAEWKSVEADGRSMAGCASRYRGKTVDQIIDEIVDVRGFLHHHSRKRRDAWHPDDHRRFECEALLLMRIAQDVAFEIAKGPAFSPITTAAVKQQFDMELRRRNEMQD